MTFRYSKWIIAFLVANIPFLTVLGQGVTDPHYDSGFTYRGVNAGVDGCGTPMCHNHKMQPTTWNETPIKEYTYRGLDGAGNVVEFMNWRMIFPVGFKWDGSVTYPLVMMLHGSGESGRIGTCCFGTYAPSDVRYDNNDANVTWGGKDHQVGAGYSTSTGNPSGTVKFNGIVAWPQSSFNGAWDGSGWNGGVLQSDNALAVKIIEWLINAKKADGIHSRFNIDPERITIHGLSAGAVGVWDLASKRPDLIASLLPMSGVPGQGTDWDHISDILLTTPIWIFQGGKDTNPSPGSSDLLVSQYFVPKGGNIKRTLYPNDAHDTWEDAYREADFFPFLTRANKKDIFVFGGDPSICPGGTLKLGVSDGYVSYQWAMDGTDIPGATTRYYNATLAGTYTVRMQRQATVMAGTTFTSNPTVIGTRTSSSVTPVLTGTAGSIKLPINLSGVNNVIQLTTPAGFPNYNFLKDGVSVQNSASNTITFSNNTGIQADAGAYTVVATQASGCFTNPSNAINVTWNNPQPTSPRLTAFQITMTPASATSITVSWAQIAGNAGYEIWRIRFGPLSFQGYSYVGTVSTNTTSYVDSGLRPGNVYRYMIRTILASGGATFSDEPFTAAQTLNDTSPPTTPTNLVASNLSTAGTSLTLTWGASSDDDKVFKYEIYNGGVFVDSVRSSDVTEGTIAPATTYNMTGLAPNTLNVFTVRAMDFSRNYSAFSEGLTVNTQDLTTGIDYKYFTYTLGTGPPSLQTFDFDRDPVNMGSTTGFVITAGSAPTTRVVFAFEGYLDIQTAGSYTFQTASRDGSMMYVDNDFTGYKTVINNDALTTRSSTGTVAGTPITFSAIGKYPIKVTFSKHTGGGSELLTVSYKIPGSGSFVTIPTARLFRIDKNYYYLKTGVSPNIASSWTPNANLVGGTSPTNFTGPQRYYVMSYHTPTVNLTGSWTVSGSGSRVIVGNGSNTGVTFNINSGGSFTGILEASKNAVINLNTAAPTSFGSLDASSMVNFNLSGSVNMPPGYYGSVNLNSGDYTYPAGSTLFKGSLSVFDGASATGTTNNLSTISVGGDLEIDASSPNPGGSNQYSLKFTGGLPHNLIVSNPTDLNFQTFIVDSSDSVVLYNGSGTTLNVGNGAGGGLFLKAGGTLNILDGNLAVAGNGSINSNSETGVLAMNGGNLTLSTTSPFNSNLYFSGTAGYADVNNLTVASASSSRLAVGSQLNIHNLVTVSSGELNSNNGALTLLSDATNSARVGPLATGSRITGAITAQRFMDGGPVIGRNYRYISSPVKGLTVAELQDSIPITGNFTGASTGTGLGSAPSMFSYSEPTYSPFPAGGSTNLDTLTRARGYAVYVRDAISPTTWEATGTPYQGTISFPLTAGTPAPNDGWNLVGNPYPSPIQWTGSTGSGWTLNNVNPTVYVRHNYGTQFKWYIYHPGINSSEVDATHEILTDGVIAAGQAFWVMADASPAMTISESAKYTPDGGTYYRTNQKNEVKPDVLAIKIASGANEDITYILHDDKGTEKFEKLQDAVKQPNSFFNLSTKSIDGISLAINVTPATFCEKSVALNIDNAVPATYTLSFFGLDKFQRPVTATLIDKFTNTTKEISEGMSYDFTITSDVASTGSGRFVITEKPIVLTNTAMKTSSVCESNPSIKLLSAQSGVEYQALFNGTAVSSAITATSSDSVTLTLDRKALGYGTHTVNLLAGYSGCEKSSFDQTVNITVDTLATPSIVHQSDRLVALPANADHYQWLHDGSPISGKTDASLVFNNEAGNFQVQVTVGACSKISSTYDVTGIDTDLNSLVKVYPNPFRDQIRVTLPEKIQGGTAVLTNTMGQRVHAVSIAPQNSNEVLLNFSTVDVGTYILSIDRYKFKIIKTN